VGSSSLQINIFLRSVKQPASRFHVLYQLAAGDFELSSGASDISVNPDIRPLSPSSERLWQKKKAG
jgi:hypothetical protein